MAKTEIRVHDYIHSPVHYAVAAADYDRLARLLSSLPRLADPVSVLTESDSLAQERLADHISAVLDRRDVPSAETPLHLAVRLSDLRAARALAGAGADVSLQNVAGWNPLQEAVCSRKSDLALALLRHHHAAAWTKWRRRLPRLVAVLRRMPDFYMEISFHFESSLLPFAKRLAPSDTYRIWKRDADLRADTSLAGFDGLKIQRADQSFLFLGGGEPSLDLPSGSLLVLNRTEKRIFDAFENAGGNLSPADEEGFAAQTSVYRPGMDVTRAELVGRTNWRRQEKTEMVGEWKARVYEIQNVMFSFKSRKAAPQFDYDPEEIKAMPLVFKDSSEDEFLVAETPSFISLEMPRRRNSSFVKADLLKDQQNPNFVNLEAPRRRNSNFERGDLMKDQKTPSFINLEVPRRRNSNFEKEDLARDQKNPSFINLDLPRRRNSSFEKGNLNLIKDNKKAWIPMDRKSVDLPSAPPQQSFDGRKLGKRTTTDAPPAGKESEYVKSLRPSVWLTEQFPLKTEELLPLLDILANKVKAVRRLRELLTTKFPPGTFPVKVAIPVVPTVKVVVTFTKFVNLEAVEQFYTPMSSPRQFGEEQLPSSSSSSSSFEADPFVIPRDYTWTSIEDKSEKIKKSKSSKKGKQ